MYMFAMHLYLLNKLYGWFKLFLTAICPFMETFITTLGVLANDQISSLFWQNIWLLLPVTYAFSSESPHATGQNNYVLQQHAEMMK